MGVIYGLENVKSDKKRVLAIGVFDGVHLGHGIILKSAAKIARENGLVATAITFREKPFGGPDIKYVSDLDTRLDLIASMGIEDIIVQDFTEELAAMTPEEFIRDVAVGRLGAVHICEGKNFRFGAKRSGDSDYLLTEGGKFGITAHIASAVYVDGEQVSSTAIREKLASGNVESAERLMGRRFRIVGKVGHGREVGMTMGFPTANITRGEGLIVPKNGVYAVTAEVGGETYRGVCNIGNRPTFDGKNTTIEVHILGFEGDIYGETMAVEFVKRIRDEKKFGSKEELAAQIAEDKKYAEESEMEKLWAPWRMKYINSGGKPTGCIFCDFPKEDPSEDPKNRILYRGEHCFVIMNAFPYSNGHLMVVPYRHTSDFLSLTAEEKGEMMTLLQVSCDILKKTARPDGFNIGMNIGAVSGAGIADHLHMHIVPRWTGDINFMPVFADVRVIAESLEDTYAKMKPHFDEYGAKK